MNSLICIRLINKHFHFNIIIYKNNKVDVKSESIMKKK